MPRKYNMAKRSKNGEELRRRIVEATWNLHDEKGILATTIHDIAERADVAPNTVYRYFPTYNDAVRACGDHFVQVVPPPTDELITGADTVPARVENFVRAWFAYYDVAGPGLEIGQKALVIPAVAENLAGIEASRLRQVGLAFGEPHGSHHALLGALTTLASWRTVKDAGMSTKEIVDVVVGAVIESQETPPSASPATPAEAEERN